MKLLLDEQMPRKISDFFPDMFEISTVQSEGWSGVENGELLSLAESRGFDALISADKNISYQQNESLLPVSVVVLHVNRLRIKELSPLIPIAIERLKDLSIPAFIRIDV